MLFKKTILSMTALFMAASGMPVYAEQAPTPEVTERKDDAAASTETESVLGIKKLYAEEPETLTTGKNFNAAIKTLAAGTAKKYIDSDSLIKAVQVTEAMPSGSITTKDVSADHDGSYLAWWDAGTSTINLYSKSGDVVLNPDCSYMFYYCSELTTLDASNWNTSQVTDMSRVFYECRKLTTLDVSKWNTSQVTSMSYMFYGCSKLTALDLSGWNTSKVMRMNYMFRECGSLTTLDVSDWNTSSVTYMGGMFRSCSSLTTLDVSKWDTSRVTNMGSMFQSCGSLVTIYIGPGWSTDKVTLSSSMFTGCTNLPNFNYDVVDKTNANADPDTGYMSYKVAKLKYLKGSSFVISGTSDYGTQFNVVVTSDKNGRLSFKNLEKGTYTLTEVSPTDGYIKNSGKYTVTVTDSGVSVVSDNPDFYYETEDQKVLFNEPYHSFTIQKTSSVDSTAGVEGAEFLLSGVSDYGTEVSQPETTGKTGVATFDHLEAGSYLLTETKAPEHFALDPVSRIVTINKYGVVKIDGLSKEGSSFVWTDIRNADGTITITKNWKDTLTGTAAANRALPIIVISDQRTIPDAVKVTYYAGDGYFGTEQTNKTNAVTYTEKVDKDGNILSVSASKGQEMTPSMTGKMFDAWYLDLALTNKAPDTIVDYIKAKPNEKELALHAKYKDPPMLTTGVKFNEAIKALAAGTRKDYFDTDSLIQSIRVVNTLPSENITTKDVSASNDGSYLVWWDADAKTIKLYSKYGKIILNPYSNGMFRNCASLATLDVSNWDTSKVTDMSSMFYSCTSLTTLDVSGWNTGSVTDMNGMFSGSGLATLALSGWNTSSVKNMGTMFSGCSSLTTLDLSGWDTSNVRTMNNMFQSCTSLTTLDVSNWNTGGVMNMVYMFNGCSSLTTLDLSKWNTSQVKDMSYMFHFCTKLTTLDVSKWDTGSVTNMSYMFRYCSSLTTLDVSGWNTGSVTNMSHMFYGCSKLTALDLSGWNTSKVTRMNYMFRECTSLATLALSGWDTSQVTNMSNMFNRCSKLTTLDLSGWDTSQVTNMSNMFNRCSKLATMDVSSWDTSKVTDMSSLFYNCSSLEHIYIGSGWNTDKVTSSGGMFYKCTKLPNFNSSVVDKTNAHAGAGGYMELK